MDRCDNTPHGLECLNLLYFISIDSSCPAERSNKRVDVK